MEHQLFIVGTAHHLQYGAGITFGGQLCTESGQVAFEQLLRKLCSEVSADTIAEELSQQSMKEVGSIESVPHIIAKEAGLPHIFCDPNREERRQLGILDENEIRMSKWPKVFEEPGVQRLLAESNRRREAEWLRRIQEMNGARVILVCGAIHSDAVAQLAQSRLFKATIIHRDWEV
jgi:hypothetical protein